MKGKIISRALFVFAAVTVLIFAASIVAGARQEKAIASKMLRLHVLANSDTSEDQELKLKVRDAVLSEAQTITDGASTLDEVKQRITSSIALLETAAKECLAANGCVLPVKVMLERCMFPTKNYGFFSLPAGEYEALRVMIGEAQGQNWWCVLFPPLCNAAASEEFVSAAAIAGISEENIALMEGKRVFKFRLAELFAYIRSLIQV